MELGKGQQPAIIKTGVALWRIEFIKRSDINEKYEGVSSRVYPIEI